MPVHLLGVGWRVRANAVSGDSRCRSIAVEAPSPGLRPAPEPGALLAGGYRKSLERGGVGSGLEYPPTGIRRRFPVPSGGVKRSDVMAG